jgi:ribosome-associated toxin RatA of RatAB toxin-antitoxin module
MRAILFLIIALFMISPVATATAGGDVVHGGWILESERDGIKIYTRVVRGSKLKQVRAIVSVHVSMETVVRALTDYPNYHKWMNNVTESYVVDHPADSVHYVYRFEDAPWPVQNRYHVDKMIVAMHEKSATLEFKSMPNYMDKSEQAIEIQRFEGSWKVSEVSQNECQIEYILDENPGGYVPQWLVNYMAIDAPFKTLSNLRERLEALQRS